MPSLTSFRTFDRQYGSYVLWNLVPHVFTNSGLFQVSVGAGASVRTNFERNAERHRKICERAEREFLDGRKKNPKLTVPKTVKAYAGRCDVPS
jgi:hypothetical protein